MVMRSSEIHSFCHITAKGTTLLFNVKMIFSLGIFTLAFLSDVSSPDEMRQRFSDFKRISYINYYLLIFVLNFQPFWKVDQRVDEIEDKTAESLCLSRFLIALRKKRFY